MAHEQLVEWIGKQPSWARDALRRHALFPNYLLDSESKAEIVARVRQAAGLSDGIFPEEPFRADHLSRSNESESRTLLVSMGPVKNIARLAEGQCLSFAIDGITLIYGDNGTGKSGYCRITKKLCRSATTEDLIGNVFLEGKKPPAEVQVRFLREEDAEPTTVTWKDGTPTPDAIGNISIFDSRNARLYVDAENKIGFLPREVAILEQFAQHCGEMDKLFESEVKSLQSRIAIALPAAYTPNGLVQKLLSSLKPKAALPASDEIRRAAEWTNKDQEELESLETTLTQDPQVLAERYRQFAVVITKYKNDLSEIEERLTPEAARALQRQADEARDSAAAAALAASELFNEEPITGVGLPPWRRMYDHAVEYFRSVYPDSAALPAAEGELCVLCQQPLSGEASARMQRFEAFIADKSSKAAEEARQSLEKMLGEIQAINIPKMQDAENALAEYRKLSEDSEKLASAIIESVKSGDVRRAALLDAGKNGDFSMVGEPLGTVDSLLAAEISRLESAAEEFGKAATDDSQRVAARERFAELKDRRKLADDLDTVLARLNDLQSLAKLGTCRELVNTRQVSLQITNLRRALVTTDLEKRIKGEIDSLDLTHLPFRVTDRSSGGESYFAVALQTPVGVANEKVLSEGEQRALALACYLGELNGTPSNHGIVIDDPVSSLDHIRIRRVARRITDEAAKGRQVIIFTHNLLFFNEVVEAAAQGSPQVPVVRRIVTKSATDGFGLISERESPWIAQKVTERIMRLKERLKNLEGRTDFDNDDYRARVKDFYTDLRETWERLVEEVLLGKVVERFNTDVRTQSLKDVVVEDEDHKTVFWGMKRASERSGHDMAAARNVPVPKPEDLKSDLKAIEDYRISVDRRRKEASERRKALEEPPKAKTL